MTRRLGLFGICCVAPPRKGKACLSPGWAWRWQRCWLGARVRVACLDRLGTWAACLPFRRSLLASCEAPSAWTRTFSLLRRLCGQASASGEVLAGVTLRRAGVDLHGT